jgi:hypothetical protein
MEIRQHRLKLESTQVGESTRLGKGWFLTLKQQHGNLLTQFRLGQTRRL